MGYVVAPNQCALSYEEITGVWTGELPRPPGPSDRVIITRVEFGTKCATATEEVGTVQRLEKENGTTICAGDLVAHHSDPPTYWVDVDSDDHPCRNEVRYRFRHDPDEGILQLFTKRDLVDVSEEPYEKGATLRRESG